MEVYTDIPKKFMAKFDRHEPVVQDHTATIAFKKCPRRYFYEVVLGFRDKSIPVYLNFGQAYHKFREVLEIEYINKKDCSDKKLRYTESFPPARDAALKLWDKLQPSDPPVGTKFDFYSRGRLVASIIEAYKWWVQEKEAGNVEVIATEQAINIVLETTSGRRIVIGGRADQIIRRNGHLWGRDFKTTTKSLDYYDRRNDPNDQFTRYTYMESAISGERLMGQLVEVLYNNREPKRSSTKTPAGPLIRPFIVAYTENQVDRWVEEQEYWDDVMRLAREKDMYAMSYVGCEWCPFRSICTSSTEQSMMAKLEQNFIVRIWDHAAIGDDD